MPSDGQTYEQPATSCDTRAVNAAVQHFLTDLRDVSLQHSVPLRELAAEVFGALDGLSDMERLVNGRWTPDIDELGRLHEALDASARSRPFKKRRAEVRLAEGLAQRRLSTTLATDPVDCLFLHLDLQRQQLRRLEARTEDFPLATALIVGLAERGLTFVDMTAEQAVFHELDRLSARVIELEAQRQPNLRVVK